MNLQTIERAASGMEYTEKSLANTAINSQEGIDLTKYWRIIRYNKWNIIGIGGLFAVLAVIAMIKSTPIYRSTGSILIDAQQSKILMMNDAYEMQTLTEQYFRTQIELLKSRDLIRKVIEKLDLADNPEFNKPKEKNLLRAKLTALLPAVFENKDEKNQQNDIDYSKYSKEEGLISDFQSRLAVNPRKLTQVLDISFEASDPLLASDIVNILGETYIQTRQAGRTNDTRMAAEWLADRMQSLKEKLNLSESKLQNYLEKEHLVDLEGVLTLTKGEIEGNTRRLSDARITRMEAEALYKKIQSLGDSIYKNTEVVPEIFADPVIIGLKQKEITLSQKLSELSQRYGSGHDDIIATKSELESIEQELKKHIASTINGIKNHYEIALAKEKSVASEVNTNKDQVQDIGSKQTQLRELQREVDSNRNLYEMFFNRYKEATETASLSDNAIRFVDRADHPLVPVKPKKKLIVIISFMIGLVFGVILAVLRDYLNSTIKSPAEIEEKLGAALLGIVPFHKVKKADTDKISDIGKMAQVFPKSQFAESIRTIRTGLILSALDSPHNVWLITSSLSGEGKSSICMNLAISLSQLDNGKVLLIDADLRRPTLMKRFATLPEGSFGLAHVLSKTAEIDECIHNIGPNIDLIPAGLIPPNPLELLGSQMFINLLQELEKRYTMVLIDSPPINSVSDSNLLAQYVRSVIYVVRAEHTQVATIRQGLKHLRKFGAPMAGIILNQLDVEKGHGYYGTNYYYNYYQSSNYSEEKS
ncbi:polysaccharide biosynthesis tyrosine autokinase [Methylomonas paludis]|uniref:non-specific protein-tyrosine kinase n=1 Tax=Methylomonas paludis TaxID=1173101 RepID=A0A975MLH3_9GAMM|nr:polysaccharide biosynthesis tyrosine autokinase [Methylomonas paludis]QWF70051.1 polysaccharide biosynthesis tyrosine autokinase [Methylomonas paludis]